jgi:hypothetical protein
MRYSPTGHGGPPLVTARVSYSARCSSTV